MFWQVESAFELSFSVLSTFFQKSSFEVIRSYASPQVSGTIRHLELSFFNLFLEDKRNVWVFADDVKNTWFEYVPIFDSPLLVSKNIPWVFQNCTGRKIATYLDFEHLYVSHVFSKWFYGNIIETAWKAAALDDTSADADGLPL